MPLSNKKVLLALFLGLICNSSAKAQWITPSGGGGGGTVTDLSVVSANGFAGTVADSTTTPAITLTTTVTGNVCGNATALSACSTTGSGNTVLQTSPTLITPTLGVASATSVNKVALTPPATAATLTIADGKTLTANNSLTLAGTDSTTMTFPSTSATIARTDAGQSFVGTNSFDTVALFTTGNSYYTINSLYDASGYNIKMGYSSSHGGQIRLGGNAYIAWSDGSPNPNSGASVSISRTGSGVLRIFGSKLEQAAGNTAQNYNIFNTITDASNGEWGTINWTDTANVLTIGTKANGTGSTRNLQLIIGGTNKLDYGVTTASIWTSAVTFAAPAFQTSTALVTAVDGGSTATFTANMVGSTDGPTTAAQNGWVKMLDSTGTTVWVPVWK